MTAKDIFLAIVASGVMTTFVNYILNRSKNKAQIENLKIQSLSDLVEVLQGEIKRCHEGLSSYRAEINDLKDRMKSCRDMERTLLAKLSELENENKELRKEMQKLKV